MPRRRRADPPVIGVPEGEITRDEVEAIFERAEQPAPAITNGQVAALARLAGIEQTPEAETNLRRFFERMSQGVRDNYERMVNEYLSHGSVTFSGLSREQARSDFRRSLMQAAQDLRMTPGGLTGIDLASEPDRSAFEVIDQIPPGQELNPAFIPIRRRYLPIEMSRMDFRPGQRAFIEREDGTRIEITGPPGTQDIDTRHGDRLVVEELWPSNATAVDEDPQPGETTYTETPQLSLVPEQPPSYHLASIPVTEVEPGILPHGEPTASFIESVRRFGVLQPIAVVARSSGADRGQLHDTLDHSWGIADGRRRLSAARTCQQATIPALIFPAGTPAHVAHSVALVANLHRRPNPASELVAVEELARAGFPVDRIASELRLSPQVVRARMRLASLPPELRNALADGRMAISVAEQAARLPARGHARLIDILHEERRITRDDVATTRQALEREITGQSGGGLISAMQAETRSIEAISRAISRPRDQSYTIQGSLDPDNAGIHRLMAASAADQPIELRVDLGNGQTRTSMVRMRQTQRNAYGTVSFDLEEVAPPQVEALPLEAPQTSPDRPHVEVVDGREFLIWNSRRWVRQDHTREHPDIDLIAQGRIRYRGQVYSPGEAGTPTPQVRTLSTARVEWSGRRYVLEEVYNRDVAGAREEGRSQSRRAPNRPRQSANGRLTWEGTTYVAVAVADADRAEAARSAAENARLEERTRVAEEAQRRGPPVTRTWFAETFRRTANGRGSEGWAACLRRIAGAIDTIPASPDDESDALFLELSQVLAMADRLSRRAVVNAE